MSKKSLLIKIGASLLALFLLTACNNETDSEPQEDVNTEENTEETTEEESTEESE